jgi:hypothetical protein
MEGTKFRKQRGEKVDDAKSLCYFHPVVTDAKK